MTNRQAVADVGLAFSAFISYHLAILAESVGMLRLWKTPGVVVMLQVFKGVDTKSLGGYASLLLWIAPAIDGLIIFVLVWGSARLLWSCYDFYNRSDS